MNFYAVYIISSDGRVMTGEFYHQKKSLPQEILAAGILEEIKRIADGLVYSSEKVDCYYQIDGINYYVKKFGDITIAMASDLILNQRKIVQTIGWKFLRKYGEWDLLNWGGKTELFEGFDDIIQEVVQSFSNKELIGEKIKVKPLTPVAIFDLPHELQNTAISILSFEKATIEEIAEDVQISLNATKQNLNKLEELGYVRRVEVEGKEAFSISKSK